VEVPASPEPPPHKLKRLQLYYILSLVSFRPLGNIEFNLVALVQRFESSSLNSRMVNENIITRSAPDETVALLVVKPLHSALFFHLSSFLMLALLEAGVLIEPHCS
jgi:hypothetical protein